MHPEDAGRTDAGPTQPRQGSDQRRCLKYENCGRHDRATRVRIALIPPNIPFSPDIFCSVRDGTFVTVPRLHRDELNAFQHVHKQRPVGSKAGAGARGDLAPANATDAVN